MGPSPPVIREPLTTKEQEALLPNYTAMVQEAILALTSGATDQGCSVLGIFLYILNHYPMTEPVSVMNIKIRSTLIMLKRVGIVENVGEDDTDDNELEAIANEMKIDKFECASSTVVATPSDTSSNKKEAAEHGAKILLVRLVRKPLMTRKLLPTTPHQVL